MDKYLTDAKNARSTLMQEAEEASRHYMEALKNFMHEGEDMLKKFNDAIVDANTKVELMIEVRMAQWRGNSNPDTKNEEFIPANETTPEDQDITAMAEKLAPLHPSA